MAAWTEAAAGRSLVHWFWGAGQGSQVLEGLLDFCGDGRGRGQMGAHRLVTVLVGNVTGVDDGAVGRHVRRGSLDDGDWRARGTGLQVTDFVLFNTVFGFESAKEQKQKSPQIILHYTRNT